jgi:peptide/nickel transport system substrate-binding protein
VPSAANNYGGQNFSFYCNPQVDKLQVAEQSTADYNQRQQAFNQLHQVYLTAFPFVTLYAPLDIALVKSTGHNYQIGSMGAVEAVNVMNWWCAGGTC